MIIKTRTIILCGGIALMVAGIILVLWRQGFLGGDRQLLRLIKDRPDLVALYDKAEKAEEDMIKIPTKAAAECFEAGFNWKSIAERIGHDQRAFYERSLAIYEKGIAKFGKTNILFYLNAGKLAEHLDDFSKAERYYKKAIEISPADENGYLALVDLYVYKMKKPKEEILKVFNQGGTRMMDPIALISGRATYLRRIGDYKNALEDYKILNQNYPNNQGYIDIVKELENQIKGIK